MLNIGPWVGIYPACGRSLCGRRWLVAFQEVSLHEKPACCTAAFVNGLKVWLRLEG